MDECAKDDELYTRYMKEHDEDALRVLIERYRSDLTLFIYGYIHDMDDAEDLMIDSFAAATAGRNLFQRRSTFKTWLFSIGRNKARMYYRKQSRMGLLEEDADVAAPDSADPLSKMIEEEKNRKLYDALSGLKPEYREILELKYLDDMSFEEVAKVIGRTRKQTYRMMEHAREALRAILGKDEF